MEDADRAVLEFIGDRGQDGGAGFRALSSVRRKSTLSSQSLFGRVGLALARRQSRRAPSEPDHTFYVLTSRGAEAIGLAPHTFHSD